MTTDNPLSLHMTQVPSYGKRRKESHSGEMRKITAESTRQGWGNPEDIARDSGY